MEIGDKVKKKKNAGFVGEELICVIPDVPENQSADIWPCFVCADEACKEWATLWVLVDNKPAGAVCHVSDCQLEKIG